MGMLMYNASSKLFRPNSIQKLDKRRYHAGTTLQIWPCHCSSSYPKSHIDLVSIRAYWTSSSTAIQAQDVDPASLECWTSTTYLCTRTSTIFGINGQTLCVISSIETPLSPGLSFVNTNNQWTAIIILWECTEQVIVTHTSINLVNYNHFTWYLNQH